MIVPILLMQLGADGIAEQVREAWRSYELSDAPLDAEAKTIIEWAEHVLETYRTQPH